MELRLTVEVKPLPPEEMLGEKGWNWAYIPELDTGTQLRDGEDWWKVLDEFLQLHLEGLEASGRLERIGLATSPTELVADYVIHHRRRIEL